MPVTFKEVDLPTGGRPGARAYSDDDVRALADALKNSANGKGVSDDQEYTQVTARNRAVQLRKRLINGPQGDPPGIGAFDESDVATRVFPVKEGSKQYKFALYRR